MKNYILGAITSIVVFSLIAANNVGGLMTIKPSLPISTITKTGDNDELETSIRYWSKKGYIVKAITNIGGRTTYSGGLLVMEKY